MESTWTHTHTIFLIPFYLIQTCKLQRATWTQTRLKRIEHDHEHWQCCGPHCLTECFDDVLGHTVKPSFAPVLDRAVTECLKCPTVWTSNVWVSNVQSFRMSGVTGCPMSGYPMSRVSIKSQDVKMSKSQIPTCPNVFVPRTGSIPVLVSKSPTGTRQDLMQAVSTASALLWCYCPRERCSKSNRRYRK